MIVARKVEWKSSEPTTMWLAYETAVPFVKVQPIDEEIEEVWGTFRKEVDAAGHPRAVVQANSPDEGTIFFYVRKTRTHVYVKSSDGRGEREKD